MLSIIRKLERSHSRSGYKYIAYDPRSRNAYRVIYKKVRSPPMFTLFEAAMCLLQHTRPETRSTAPVSMPKAGSRQGKTSNPTRSRAPRASKPPRPTREACTLSEPCAKALSDAGSHSAASWMSKPSVRFSKDCDYFGARILMARQDQPDGVLGVIKEWHPCARASFGVVFDDKRDRIFYEDLLCKGRTDWVIVDWEDDLWNTVELRPKCSVCFHPLEQGAAAWTRCVGCGANEPGVSAASMGKRTRTNDPYRCTKIDYAEWGDGDSD